MEMSSYTFGQKSFSTKPPDKGSFPLDHDGDCKREVLRYLLCLKESKNDSSSCRDLAKDYLRCRMENDLMAKEEWVKLGFKENETSGDSEQVQARSA